MTLADKVRRAGPGGGGFPTHGTLAAKAETIIVNAALGILESFSLATMIKASNDQLIELRLAMALGGKAFCILTGDVAPVQAGVLVNAAVVPRPHRDVYGQVI